MGRLSPERERTLKLQDRAFDFARGVLGKCPTSIPNLAARELWRQLARAASSTVNNLEEADEASSDADFIAKMKIVLREAKESRVCMRLLTACKHVRADLFTKDSDEARQLAAIFATILINTKRRIEREKAEAKASKKGQLQTDNC